MAFKYIELFSGIGGFRSALDPLGGECVFASEIDPFATRAYKALYNGAPELHGDITKIDTDDIPDHDVLVGGFPCQAFSVAGQRKGFEEARGTLFFEIARIASAKQPRLMLLENVKGLLSHDGGHTFETMCAVLNDIGYAIDFRVLNSKHYGVPQNRERIFVVCDRDAEHTEWSVIGNGVEAKAKRRAQALGIRTFNFDWPTNDTVTTRLRDILEDNVDERYYLSEEKTAKLVAQLEERDFFVDDDIPEDIVMRGLGLSDWCEMVGMLDMKGNESIRRVDSAEGIAPTLTTMGGGHREPKIAVIGHLPSDSGQTGNVYNADGIAPTALNQHGKAVTKIAVECVGNVNPSGNGMNGGVYDSNGLSPTLTTNKGEGAKVVEYSRKDGIGREIDVAHTLNSSDWRGLNRNQTQNAVLETGEIRAVLTPDRPDKRQNGRRFKDDGEESFTLTAQDKHGIAIGRYPRYRIRKLTPLECWRLQGFTDAQFYMAKYYAEEEAELILRKYPNHKGKRVMAHGTRVERMSDSQLYKQAGNAVTVSVISAIGKRMIPLLDANKTEVI
jgi:DNA (cytosine-5)-methyltransferase 1